MKTIYLDVLIILNIYVNFFLLKATAKFTHTPLKSSRCIISSIIGSLFSLTILLPSENFLLSLLIKLAASGVITLIAFGKNHRYFKRLLYFYMINFIFAGTVMLLYITFKPTFMAFNNSYFYIDFSLLSLVVFTAMAYGGVKLLRLIMDKGSDTSKKYKIEISYQGKWVEMEGFADTGNTLVDSFTGKPVIFCSKDKLGFDELPLNDPQLLYTCYGFRMIPCSTVSSQGLVPLLTPDRVKIIDEESGDYKNADVLIGLTSADTKGIFNPKILI